MAAQCEQDSQVRWSQPPAVQLLKSSSISFLSVRQSAFPTWDSSIHTLVSLSSASYDLNGCECLVREIVRGRPNAYQPCHVTHTILCASSFADLNAMELQ